MTNQNKKGINILIRLLNKIENDKEDKLFSLKWDTKFKALQLDPSSYEWVRKFVGENEEGTPAKEEITKHLKFLVRELEHIAKGKTEECFLIN